jgi:hypothetical protein
VYRAMDDLNRFMSNLHAKQVSRSPTECFEEVLRNDDIAEDAFAVVNTFPVV